MAFESGNFFFQLSLMVLVFNRVFVERASHRLVVIKSSLFSAVARVEKLLVSVKSLEIVRKTLFELRDI